MRPARPVLLNLADRADLAGEARDWAGRVDVVTAAAGGRPADAVLVRPDGYVAWAASADAPDSPRTLRHALRTWFGAPPGARGDDGAITSGR